MSCSPTSLMNLHLASLPDRGLSGNFLTQMHLEAMALKSMTLKNMTIGQRCVFLLVVYAWAILFIAPTVPFVHL